MTTPIESPDVLLLTLRAARENEARWLELSPESTADIERIEQWASIAKLRRLEVERLEMLLAEITETESSSQPQIIQQ
jgi:hypothetical protein